MNSLKRYKQIKEIGKGAFKTVTLCMDSETRREVALATPTIHDERQYESFLREARINALLEHPNIVPVYDVGIDEFNVPYFVMKVLDGETFKTVLEKTRDNPAYCSLRQRLEIFLKICDAMSHAHSLGIKHLDLKPENFQVNEFGAVHICDWGLAGVTDDFGFQEFDYYDSNFRTLSGEVKGTPGYMAPEQARGEAGTKDHRTDIFALGAILYEILCFKTPFGGKDIKEVIVSTCLEDAPLPSLERPDLNIPEGLEAVALKAISKEPEERYQSVEELTKEIDAFLHGFATEAEEASFSKQLKLLYQRNITFFNTAISLVMIIFIISLSFYNNLEAKQKETLETLDEVKKHEAALKENLKKYKEEKQLNIQISPLAAKQFEMEAHRALIRNFDLELCKKNYEMALILNPDSELGNVNKARASFVRQEYETALDIYKKLDLMDRKLAKKSEKLVGKRRNIQEVYPLTTDLNEGHAGKEIKYMSWHFAIFQQDNIKKMESDLSWLMNRHHPGKNIDVRIVRQEDGFLLDFSGQKDLVDISYLIGAPISEIILSGTSVKDFDPLRWTSKLKRMTIEKGRLPNHMESHLHRIKINFEKPKASP